MDRQEAGPVNIRHVLGRELRQARQHAGLTQVKLARDIGSTQGTVSYAERGHPGSSRAFWAAADTRLSTGGTLADLYDQITRPRPAIIRQDPDMLTALRGGETRFLTVAELAGLTRLSKMTIYRLIHTGELQAHRYRRVFRIPVETARQYLTRDTPGPWPAAQPAASPAATPSPPPAAPPASIRKDRSVMAADLVNDLTARRIDGLDLEPVVYKLLHPEPGAQGLMLAEADEAVRWYRQYLKLCAWYPRQPIVPPRRADEAWHTHILDTGKYAADCQHIFGYFLHHFPYFGARGQADRQARDEAYARTRSLFADHFAMIVPAVGGGACTADQGALCVPDDADCDKRIAGSLDQERPRPARELITT